MTAAIVTGAAGAMGGAIAAELAARGHQVVLADISRRRLDPAVDRLRAAGFTAYGVRCDVTDRAAARTLVDTAIEAVGRVDVLVNVVGGYRGEMYQHVLDIGLDRFDEVLRLNLRGTFNLTQLVGRHMREGDGGRIVNISSVAKEGASGQADYAAAKAAVVAFTRSCALELAPAVTVNAVAPGVIRTSVMERIPADIRDRYRSRIPLGDFGAPADVARAVAYLVGEDGRYLTGEVLHVSGGFYGCL